MDLVIIAFGSFILACLLNYFYWKTKFKKMDEKLFNTQKSYFRSVDIARKLREKNIEQAEKEQKWMRFLNMEG